MGKTGRIIKAARKYLPMLSSIGPGGHAPTGPLEVMVDFNNSCNLHCLCCYNYSPLGPERFDTGEKMRHFDPGLFRKLLDDCASLGVGDINLAGYGEPLMHPDAGELLGEIHAKGMKASIVTNGTLLTRYPLTAALLSGATVSIQAGSEAVYNRMHPNDSRGNWGRVIEGMEMLRGAGVPITIAFVLCSENYTDIGSAIELAGRFSASLAIQPIRPFIRKTRGEAEFDEEMKYMLRLDGEQLEELRKDYPALVRLAGSRGVAVYGLDDFVELAGKGPAGGPGGRVSDPAEAFYRDHPCYTGWFFSRVLMDGTVTPCCQCVGRITLGSIEDGSFADIWNGQDYVEFRKATVSSPMVESAVWRTCPCNLCDSINQNRKIHRILGGNGPYGLLLKALRPLLGRDRR